MKAKLPYLTLHWFMREVHIYVIFCTLSSALLEPINKLSIVNFKVISISPTALPVPLRTTAPGEMLWIPAQCKLS